APHRPGRRGGRSPRVPPDGRTGPRDRARSSTSRCVPRARRCRCCGPRRLLFSSAGGRSGPRTSLSRPVAPGLGPSSGSSCVSGHVRGRLLVVPAGVVLRAAARRPGLPDVRPLPLGDLGDVGPVLPRVAAGREPGGGQPLTQPGVPRAEAGEPVCVVDYAVATVPGGGP